MKIGVVDVGGGLRGIYAAGVLDFCLEHHIAFDVCVGVSAGSANTASYLSGQKGRNAVFYTEYAFRKEYMSLHNVLKRREYLDLDYIYGTLSNSDGECPLDYAALSQNTAQWIVVACDAQTGEAAYFDRTDIAQDQYDIMKASSAIPFVCKPYPIKGKLYYDGALADPVPIKKAFALGCDKVVLILSKPRDTVRTPGKDAMIARRIQKKYPRAAERLLLRAETYNQGVSLAKEYEAQGKVLIVAPDDTCGADTLSRDRNALNRLYKKGICDGAKILPFLKEETISSADLQ